MGWISCCVRNGREPFRARASADIEEAPRLSVENRREAYVPESWCPPVGSPRRYIFGKGAKGGVRGTARGKPRFPSPCRRRPTRYIPVSGLGASARKVRGASGVAVNRAQARGAAGFRASTPDVQKGVPNWRGVQPRQPGERPSEQELRLTTNHHQQLDYRVDGRRNKDLHPAIAGLRRDTGKPDGCRLPADSDPIGSESGRARLLFL